MIALAEQGTSTSSNSRIVSVVDRDPRKHPSRDTRRIMPRPVRGGAKANRRAADRQAHQSRAQDWAHGNYTHRDLAGGGSDSDGSGCGGPPDLDFRIAMWDLGQCDRKRCTGAAVATELGTEACGLASDTSYKESRVTYHR